MPKSKVNPHCKEEFNEEKWLISIINTGSKSGGHAAFVVEGIETDPSKPLFPSAFIGQYDIAANAEEKQDSSINTKGYITKIKVYENEECTRDYEKLNYPAKSYIVSREQAKRMIIAIKQDRDRTEAAMRNLNRAAHSAEIERDAHGDIIQPFRFQYLGKNHPLVKFFGDSAAGNNCAGWCLEKLTDATYGAGIEDSTLPKPKVVSGQCAIL